MDFFAAEQRARKRTARLLVLFGLAVLATVAAGYFGTLFGLDALRISQARRYGADAEQLEPGPLWRPQVMVGVAAGTLGVIALASLYKWSEFRTGGSAVAESVGGRRIDPHTTDLSEQRLLHVVEEMAIAAGLPVPAVYVMDGEPGINAFAAGLTPSDTVVTVTRGSLQKLTRDELQGVIGHEFSHVLNGDMRTNVQLASILFGILVIGLAGRAALWSLRFGRVGSSRDKNNGAVVVLAIGAGLLVIGYAGYFFGRLIQASVSRQREFLADASSVQFTRNPAGITGALKKIGGYAIGSSMQTHQAAGIGHFFFAQAALSNFGGLWATHPPLSSRIRAIDPAFDGTFPEPAQVIDVAREPWSHVPDMPKPAAPRPQVALGAALAAAAGSLTAEATADARSVIADIPEALRTAARSPHDAPALIYGLILEDDEGARTRQTSVVARQAGSETLEVLRRLDPALRGLGPEHRLPALQLALPTLKAMPAEALSSFSATLDEVVKAGDRVSAFEFAMKRIVQRELALSRAPASSVIQIYSFQAVTQPLSVVLSVLAHASSEDEAEAAAAFAEGAAELKLVQSRLAFLPGAQASLEALGAALDTLATSSGPIKQRLLIASAHVVGADGVILPAEAELLRAVASSLDVPVPPVALRQGDAAVAT